MSDQLQHLWIPDEEVEQLDKKARPPIKDYGLDHSQHGAVLSSGLQNVMTAYSHLKDDSLSDEDLVIFKMVLPESEDIYTRREIATKEGLKINAVKDKQQKDHKGREEKKPPAPSFPPGKKFLILVFHPRPLTRCCP